MGQGISEILTFAVGVAISPIPVIAIILMLFSERARVNGSAFLIGWVAALGIVSVAVYTLSDASNASTSTTASDTFSWGKIALGVLLLFLAARTWHTQPGPREQPRPPKWMRGIDQLTPGKALGLGLALAGVSPKKPHPHRRRGREPRATRPLRRRRRRLADRLRHDRQPDHRHSARLLPRRRRARHDATGHDQRLATAHNAAVMTVLFLVFGANLIAKGIPPLSN